MALTGPQTLSTQIHSTANTSIQFHHPIAATMSSNSANQGKARSTAPGNPLGWATCPCGANTHNIQDCPEEIGYPDDDFSTAANSPASNSATTENANALDAASAAPAAVTAVMEK